MQKKSFFKIVFWVLIGLISLVILGGIISLTVARIYIDPDFPVLMGFYFTIFLLFIAVIIAALSVFIYKDSSKRGMDPWMWMTIVVFLPNLIGLIIYLIVRKSNTEYENKCISCGKPVGREFKLCPYCGTELDIHCSKCGKQVSPEWNVCPYCSESLK